MNAAIEPLTVGYEQDFHAWALHQAALVRARRFADLDLDNLAEEIESMGRSQLRAVGSLVARIVAHLLFLQFSPAVNPRSHWRGEVSQFRRDVERHLRDSPSLQHKLADALLAEWRGARRVALEKLAQDSVRELPEDCLYTVGQVLDAAWWPAHEPGDLSWPARVHRQSFDSP